MNNHDSSPALAGGSYMPYSYAAGIFQTYGQSIRPGSSHVYRSPAADDFFSNRPTDQWQVGRLPSVEQIIASGYLAVPPTLPETAILSDKHDVAHLGLDDLIHQVRSRQALYQQNMMELAYSVCEAHNSVHRQVADQGRPADSRQQYSLQKQVQKLYEQQREERVNLWRDVSRLRLNFPEATQNYLLSSRKLALLDDDRGDDGRGGGA